MSTRVIVAGGRNFTDYNLLKSKLNHLLSNTKGYIEIVSGACNTGKLTWNREDGTIVCGADGLGERYANEKKINVVYFAADWDKHGKAAGPIRNKMMAEYATHCVCFWDGISKGTMNMMEEATVAGIRLVVIRYQEPVKK